MGICNTNIVTETSPLLKTAIQVSHSKEEDDCCRNDNNNNVNKQKQHGTTNNNNYKNNNNNVNDIESFHKESRGDDDDDNNQNHTTSVQVLSSSSNKTIGIIGSLAIAVNSLAGPAILQLPFQFQHSGLIPTTICLIFVGILSGYCCLHMANTISKIKNNKQFNVQVEFSDPFHYFWNTNAYKVTQILFFLTTICLNIAAIVDTAEIVDTVFGLYATSYGISFFPPNSTNTFIEIKSWNIESSTLPFRTKQMDKLQNMHIHSNHFYNKGTTLSSVDFNISDYNISTSTYTPDATANATSTATPTKISDIVPSTGSIGGTSTANSTDSTITTIQKNTCTREEVKLGLCDPFNNINEYGHYLLTIGYIITAIVFVPICLKDLKENTLWQIFGFGILLTLCTYFCICFSSVIKLKTIYDNHRVSLWGHTWGGMLGVIMFNFALVLAIPAWLHEKQSNVSVRKTVVQSTIISTTLYIAVGISGALAIPHVNVNMLSPMVSGAYGTGMQYAGTLFAFFIIGLDIPLFCVLTRYNLTHSGLCSVRTANWLVVYIPWSLSWIFYQGDAIGILLSWGGVLLTSAVAFILPLYLSLRALQMSNIDDYLGSIQIYSSSIMMSRQQQIQAVKILLALACTSVTCAIIGQITSQKHLQQALHSRVYLNSTETLASNSISIANKQLHESIDYLSTIHTGKIVSLQEQKQP